MRKKTTNIFGKIIASIIATVLVIVAGVSTYCLFDKDFRKQVEQKLHIEQSDNSSDLTSENQTEIIELEEQLKEQQQENQDIKDENSNLKTEISENQAEIEELENQIISKQNALNSVNAELETALAENSENQEVIETLQAEKNELESDIETLQAEKNELEQLKNDIEKQLEDTESENADLMLQIETLNIQIEEKQSEINDLNSEVLILENKIKEYENYNQTTVESEDVFTSQRNYTINLNSATQVNSIINNTTSTVEESAVVSAYGTSFGNKIESVLSSDVKTSSNRFISKDGDKVAFLNGSQILIYQNINSTLVEILNDSIEIENILKISFFDNYVFVFTQAEPYITAYVIENSLLTKCELNLTQFENYANLANYLLCDIVQGKNGVFMLGFVVPVSTTTAYTLYLNFDDSSKTFLITNYVSTADYEFSYMLAFHKNNFSDAEIYYLKSGTNSSTCKRIIHKLDGTIADNYTVFAYQLVYLTKNIEVKSRAVLIDKDYDVNFWVFNFPQIYRYQIDIFNDAKRYWYSEHLNYMIQELQDGTFKAYSMVNYDEPVEISIPDELDLTQISDIEILDNVAMFFNEDETINIWNFYEDKLFIENVSSNKDSYTIALSRKLSLSELIDEKAELQLEIDNLQTQLKEKENQLTNANNTITENEKTISNLDNKLNLSFDFLKNNIEIFDCYYFYNNETKAFIQYKLKEPILSNESVGVEIYYTSAVYVIDFENENIKFIKNWLIEFNIFEETEEGLKITTNSEESEYLDSYSFFNFEDESLIMYFKES